MKSVMHGRIRAQIGRHGARATASPPLLRRAFWLAALAGLILALGGVHPAHAQKKREGYLVHERDATKTLYFYRIIEDSLVYIRQETDETGAALALPPLVVRQLNAQLNQMAPLDSTQLNSVALTYENNRLLVNLAQNVNMYALAAFFVAFVVLAVALLVWFRRRLRQEEQRQRDLIEMRKRLSEGREDERLRLAQELHDGPVQDLHAVRMHLTMMQPATHPEASLAPQPAIDGIQQELLHVIHELRSISENLRPPALVPFGLSAAIQAHVERFRQLHPGLDVTLDLAEDAQRLPERVRLALFRICQEALNNAAQHARAGRIAVRFDLDGRQALLEIRDDGRGFEVPEAWIRLGQTGHYGLLGMSERAESIGAALSVRSAEGEGTSVRVTVPRTKAVRENDVAHAPL